MLPVRNSHCKRMLSRDSAGRSSLITDRFIARRESLCPVLSCRSRAMRPHGQHSRSPATRSAKLTSIEPAENRANKNEASLYFVSLRSHFHSWAGASGYQGRDERPTGALDSPRRPSAITVCLPVLRDDAKSFLNGVPRVGQFNEALLGNSCRAPKRMWLREAGTCLEEYPASVPRGRIELPTPAFSGPRSTGELPRHRDSQ
jgi:hypothetical protein